MDQKKAHEIASGLRKAQERGVTLHETESIIVIEDAEIQRLYCEIKQLQQTVNDWRGQVDVESLQGMEWKDKAEKAEAQRDELLEACRNMLKKANEIDSDSPEAKHAGILISIIFAALEKIGIIILEKNPKEAIP